MTQRFLANWGAAVVSLIIPAWVLTIATGPAQEALGLAVAPFGWTRLLVVHLLATLPLSMLAALAIRRRVAGRGGIGSLVFGAGLGTGVTLATIIGGASVGELLDARQAGFEARLAMRVFWCLALEWPWCLVGLCLVTAATDRRRPAPAWAWLVSALLAVAAPVVYTDALIDVQSQKAEELLQRGRFVPARSIVAGLCDLNSTRPLAGTPAPALRSQLEQQIQALTAAVRVPLPPEAPPEAHVQRASCLAVLGRLDEAERQLHHLADTNAAALLLLAALRQDQQRWEESSRGYREALVLLEPVPVALEARVRAYDGLAFNARAQKKYREAEEIYDEALARLPEAQAYFHFQLGRHHQLGGRPGKALHHLQTAARLDPTAYANRVRPLLDELMLHTPGCFLRWSGP